MSNRGYKRSWKNLLINKRYQLRFTLFMVGLSAVLMLGLGIWVMRTVDETTRVAMSSERGVACPKVPEVAPKPKPDDEDAPAPATMKLDEGSAGSGSATAGSGSAGSATDTGSGSAADSDEPKHANVQIVESKMTLIKPDPALAPPPIPADFQDRIVQHWTCVLAMTGRLDELERGRMRIFWTLIASGIVLAIGLAIYGIKTTHKVAGPLFKVRLYFAKMKEGRFDTVYPLRKGDQLVDFYEHFRSAHAGVVAFEKADIAKLKTLIAAAEAAGQGNHASVTTLRDILARKEKAIA
jgi:hypothetical protein